VCDLYQKRFGSDKSPRPFQITVRDAAKKISEPSIMIVEAPMGEGKTWAALVASEILAQRFGFGGIFFALPTQATANGLFSTIKQWAGKVINYGDTASLYLAHGKSEYNEEYRDMPNIGGSNEVCEGLAVHEWLQDKRKGLLSEFAVGTVDQVLMGGLKQKYLCMRHLGLVNKVVIIDECHAYDAYMGSYLSKILNWLGAYRVPVIILSATLPPTRRRELIDAYTSKGDAKKLRQNRSDAQPWTSNAQYPLITYVDRGEIKQECSEPSNRSLEVHIVRIADEDGGVLDYIGKQSEGGGYIGIVRNTVKRAQDFAKKLTNRFPSARVCLLHAGFVSIDRVEKEASIMEALKGNRPPSAT
jgi:CRISPR-associated endonuclease/helicase Cas3